MKKTKKNQKCQQKKFVKKENETMKYVCDVCGWIYDEKLGDEDMGILPGTKFEDLPEDFLCPLCMVGKEEFSPMEQNNRKVVRIGAITETGFGNQRSFGKRERIL